MTPLEGFDRIVSALYASALDDAHWSVASALIDEAVGAAGNALAFSTAASSARTRCGPTLTPTTRTTKGCPD